jgi:hypothetical protein
LAHLVIGYPSPLAACVVRRLVERGDVVIVVGSAGSPPESGVDYVIGDAARIDFGLSGEQYNKLRQVVRRITVVESTEQHAHGRLQLRDLETSRPVRVAAEVKEFAECAAQLDALVYLSSLSIFGDRKGTVLERDFLIPRSFTERREEVLAVAEKQMHHIEAEVPTAIVRTGSLVGSEDTGALLIGSELARLAQFALAAPDECEFVFTDRPVHFETLERATDVLLRVHGQHPAVALHVVDDDPWTDRQLVLWLFEHVHKRAVEIQRNSSAVSQLLRATTAQPGRVRTSQAEFERAEAVRQLGPLLNRDVASTLSRLFRSTPLRGVLS